mmetsp:Transcript_41197/g.128429  ORF Transcript_41197/g.128429 Transcript_41197/m.128429 type:complete len:311 (-) Transcript_41197:579-1511(-)
MAASHSAALTQGEPSSDDASARAGSAGVNEPGAEARSIRRRREGADRSPHLLQSLQILRVVHLKHTLPQDVGEHLQTCLLRDAPHLRTVRPLDRPLHSLLQLKQCSFEAVSCMGTAIVCRPRGVAAAAASSRPRSQPTAYCSLHVPRGRQSSRVSGQSAPVARHWRRCRRRQGLRSRPGTATLSIKPGVPSLQSVELRVSRRQLRAEVVGLQRLGQKILLVPLQLCLKRRQLYTTVLDSSMTFCGGAILCEWCGLSRLRWHCRRAALRWRNATASHRPQTRRHPPGWQRRVANPSLQLCHFGLCWPPQEG